MIEQKPLGGFDTSARPEKIFARTHFSPFFAQELTVGVEVDQNGLEELIISGFEIVASEGTIDERAKDFLAYLSDAKLYFNSPVVNNVSLESISNSVTRLRIKTEDLASLTEEQRTEFITYSDCPLEFWLAMERICQTAAELDQQNNPILQELRDGRLIPAISMTFIEN